MSTIHYGQLLAGAVLISRSVDRLRETWFGQIVTRQTNRQERVPVYVKLQPNRMQAGEFIGGWLAHELRMPSPQPYIVRVERTRYRIALYGSRAKRHV
ncbi:MAG: hypothetical protein HYX63_07015 [Gammaproteobacteria bacterium]|nr:hypothetical protein [Gammaproteobacteria bacterium]